MRFILLTVLALTFSTEAAIAGAPGVTLEDVRDQGILYFKKGHFKQARSKLRSAYKMKGGKADFHTVYYLGRSSYKLLLLEDAFRFAGEAEKLSKTEKKRKRRVTEFKEEMSNLYGEVSFKAAKGETNKKGRIFFESKTGTINPAKKKRFMSIRERFRSTDISLPARVFLPYGDYLANKVPFSIVQGEETPDVEIFLQVVVDTPESNLWWYVGIGSSAAVVAGLGAYFIFSGPETVAERQIKINFEEQQR